MYLGEVRLTDQEKSGVVSVTIFNDPAKWQQNKISTDDMINGRCRTRPIYNE